MDNMSTAHYDKDFKQTLVWNGPGSMQLNRIP